MKYRALGNTGLEVSEIGFGAWGIGGRTDGATSYGETEDAVSERALATAIDVGINFFDTSNVYGYGRSERLIGKVFQGCRDRLVIATKAGIKTWDAQSDFSPDALRASLEGSLARLKTDYVDLLQLHNPTLDELRERPEIVESLRDFISEGKIRAFGASMKSPVEGVVATRDFGFQTVQVNLNMMDVRAVECGLADNDLDLGRPVIARTPLSFGFLSGRVDRDTVFPDGDHRAAWTSEQIARWVDGANELSAAINSVNDGETRTQTALRYCLSHSGVATVIPGMLKEEEVIENSAASMLAPITLAELDAILEINRQTNFFVAKS